MGGPDSVSWQPFKTDLRLSKGIIMVLCRNFTCACSSVFLLDPVSSLPWSSSHCSVMADAADWHPCLHTSCNEPPNVYLSLALISCQLPHLHRIRILDSMSPLPPSLFHFFSIALLSLIPFNTIIKMLFWVVYLPSHIVAVWMRMTPWAYIFKCLGPSWWNCLE